jgi:hypothetical protein
VPIPDEGEPTEMERAQDALDPVLESLKAKFGERWGSAWLDWEGQPTINIGLVEPTPEDIAEVVDQAKNVGWLARLVAVRYSAGELGVFQDRVTEVLKRGPHIWTSCAADPRLNKIVVEVPEIEPRLLQDLISSVPSDALIISVQPSGVFVTGADGVAARTRSLPSSRPDLLGASLDRTLRHHEREDPHRVTDVQD